MKNVTHRKYLDFLELLKSKCLLTETHFDGHYYFFEFSEAIF